jgi:hypothetical protein
MQYNKEYLEAFNEMLLTEGMFNKNVSVTNSDVKGHKLNNVTIVSRDGERHLKFSFDGGAEIIVAPYYNEKWEPNVGPEALVVSENGAKQLIHDIDGTWGEKEGVYNFDHWKVGKKLLKYVDTDQIIGIAKSNETPGSYQKFKSYISNKMNKLFKSK